MKLKPILPSLREKKRYIAFEVLSEKKLSNELPVRAAIMGQSLEYLGYSRVSESGIAFLSDQFDVPHQRGILRVSHRYLDSARCILAMIREIDGKKAMVRSIGVSGILKKTRERYICCGTAA